MLFTLIISLVLLQLKLVQNNDFEKISLDFLESYKGSKQITAYLCQSKGSQVKFWKAFLKFDVRLLNFFSHNLIIGQPEQHQFFIIDFACPNSLKILQEAELTDSLQRSKWLLWNSSLKLLQPLFLGLSSQIFLIKDSDNEKLIISPYKFGRDSKEFQEQLIGKWSEEKGFFELNTLTIGRNRSNVMGYPIGISYVITNPDTTNHLSDYRDTHIDGITKVNYQLVQHLISFMNCSSNPIFQSTWGYKNPNTSMYSGLIGDLQMGKAELGGTPSFFTTDRLDIVDYIAPTTPTFMKFIFRAPPLSYVTNVFTLPFHSYVWYVCFLMVALFLPALYLIVFWEWKEPYFSQNIQNNQKALRPNIFDVFMTEIGAITQQGSDTEPHSFAGRIATLFAFIILMFLYNAYSANIVALLQSTTDSIRTLEDLLNSRMKLGVEDIVYAHYYFKTAEDPTRKAIYEQKIAPKGQKNNFMSLEEGIRRMREGFFAFHVECSSGYKMVSQHYLESEKCGLKEINFINLLEPMITSRKNSTYNEVFKIGFKKLKESGINNRELSRVYTSKPICLTKGSNFGSAGLLDVYAAFLIFGIGIALSLILLMAELILRKKQIRKLVCFDTSSSVEVDQEKEKVFDEKANKSFPYFN